MKTGIYAALALVLAGTPIAGHLADVNQAVDRAAASVETGTLPISHELVGTREGSFSVVGSGGNSVSHCRRCG